MLIKREVIVDSDIYFSIKREAEASRKKMNEIAGEFLAAAVKTAVSKGDVTKALGNHEKPEDRHKVLVALPDKSLGLVNRMAGNIGISTERVIAGMLACVSDSLSRSQEEMKCALDELTAEGLI